MSDDNPYASPQSTKFVAADDEFQFKRGPKKGPALYIVSFAMLVPLLVGAAVQSQWGNLKDLWLLLPVSGCVLGALIYRWRSRNWPKDPTAKGRIVRYSLLAILLPTAIIYLMTGGGRAQGAGMVLICLLVGISVATGIVISGSRRHGSLVSALDSTDSNGTTGD